MLSLDFNAERLYKQAHFLQIQEPLAPIGAPKPIFQCFKVLYTLLFAPQDRLIENLDQTLFKQIAHQDYPKSPQETQKIWSDLFSTAMIVNLGLSTQMFILGLCSILGHPYWYIYSIYLQVAYVSVIQILRALRLKRYLLNSKVAGSGS
jgi:hypothetical protein